MRADVCWEDGVGTHRDCAPALAGSTALPASDITCIAGTSQKVDALVPNNFRGDAAEEPLLSEPGGAED